MEHEIIDLLDEQGNKIGTIDKAIAHKKGLWHRSVHVWIINDKGQILLQKRCSDKNFFPNFWDCSFAGHIDAGEDSATAALREGKEELGIDLTKDQLQFLFTIKEELVWQDIKSNEFVDVYLLKSNITEKSLSFQAEEVETAKFFDIKEFYKNISNADIFPHYQEYELLKPFILK